MFLISASHCCLPLIHPSGPRAWLSSALWTQHAPNDCVLTPSLLPSAVRCCLPPPSPPSRQVLELGSALGLKEHSVRDGEGREVKLACPVESKGILGSDDRWGGRKGGGARKGTWGGGCGEEDVGR